MAQAGQSANFIETQIDLSEDYGSEAGVGGEEPLMPWPPCWPPFGLAQGRLLTIATMPALSASGSVGHALTTAARSGGWRSGRARSVAQGRALFAAMLMHVNGHVSLRAYPTFIIASTACRSSFSA